MSRLTLIKKCGRSLRLILALERGRRPGISVPIATLNWNPDDTLGSLRISDPLYSTSEDCFYTYDNLVHVGGVRCTNGRQKLGQKLSATTLAAKRISDVR